jgi:alkylation response protein AidB-like acyl-CoA dehydrogenase
MDFALTPEQELLKNEARHFLDGECPKKVIKQIEESEPGYSPEIWRKMAQLGWLGLVLPEEYGGINGSLLDLAVLFEELGKTALPSPMFSTIMLGALPLLDAGNDQQKKELLPRVADGELIFTLALSEPEVDYNPAFIKTKAKYDEGNFVISGTKLFVPYAGVADYMLVVARTARATSNSKGITVFLVPTRSKGIRMTALNTSAGDRQFEVVFNRVVVSSKDVLGKVDEGWPLVEKAMLRATAIQCAQTVGIMQQALSMTASYTSTRIQFDRPIGSFQAVQHRLADMLTDVEGARWLSYQAVYRLGRGLPAAREVAIAKAWTGDACQRVAYGAQHLHGGIGMDLDYDLHFYFRWAKIMELSLGAAPYHLTAIEPTVRE